MEIFLIFLGVVFVGALAWGLLSSQSNKPPPGFHRVEPPAFSGGPVEYDSYDAFKRDSTVWVRQGWRIASVTDVPQRAGAKRIASIGIGAVVWKPKPHVLAVYERDSP